MKQMVLESGYMSSRKSMSQVSQSHQARHYLLDVAFKVDVKISEDFLTGGRKGQGEQRRG